MKEVPNHCFLNYSQNSIQRGARLLKIELVISDFVISKTNVLGMEEKGFFEN